MCNVYMVVESRVVVSVHDTEDEAREEIEEGQTIMRGRSSDDDLNTLARLAWDIFSEDQYLCFIQDYKDDRSHLWDDHHALADEDGDVWIIEEMQE